MKQRTLALLLAGVLMLSLPGAAALAAEGDQPAPDASAASDAGAQVSAEEPAAPAGSEEGAPAEDPVASIEEYIPDPAGSISFANVSRRMHEGNLQVKAIQENIDLLEELDYEDLKDKLRDQLNNLANTQWNLMLVSAYMNEYDYRTAYDRLDQAYTAVREQFDAIKDGDMQEDNAETVLQLKNLQNQIVMAGESTYVALAAMELQEDGLERQLAALDRQLTELDLRYELGHISSMTLKQAKSGRAALSSGLSTLRMNLNAYKGQLELLLGAEISGEIALGPLPKVTQEDLNRMNLEQDLETAKENNWDIHQATEDIKEEVKLYNSLGGDLIYDQKKNNSDYMRARHNWYVAKYTYDNTIQNFELSLRNLYLKVQDYKQILDAAKTALAVEQDNYAAAQLKQSQGTLSRNGLLDAADKLTEAREKVAGAENDLFSAYNTYRWAVDYGIMN